MAMTFVRHTTEANLCHSEGVPSARRRRLRDVRRNDCGNSQFGVARP